MGLIDRVLERIAIRNHFVRCCLSEFFCTVFFFFNSCSASGQVTLDNRNDWLGYCLALCFDLTLSIQMGSVASGNCNPAISFFLFMNGFISVGRLLVYIVMQTAGAFCGAALAYFVYYNRLTEYDGGERHMAGPLMTSFMFFANPQDYNIIWKAFIENIAAGCVLGIVGTMVYDPSTGVNPSIQPVLAGLGIALTGLSQDITAGFELNPARYLGCRLFTLCVGYGRYDTNIREAAWFWIPVFCPMIGTTIGSWLFKIFIGCHAKAVRLEKEEKAKAEAEAAAAPARAQLPDTTAPPTVPPFLMYSYDGKHYEFPFPMERGIPHPAVRTYTAYSVS